MSELRMAVIGATGLIGRTLMERAVDVPGIRLAAIARRRIDLPKGARMEMFVAEPLYWDDVIQTVRPHVIVSALGTTRKKVGNDEAAEVSRSFRREKEWSRVLPGNRLEVDVTVLVLGQGKGFTTRA